MNNVQQQEKQRARRIHPVAPRAANEPFGSPPPSLGMPQALRAGEPDREAQALLRMFNLALVPRSPEQYPLNQLRQLWRLTALTLSRRLPVATVNEVVIGGPRGPITLRVFAPSHSAQPRPAFLWCFGGGFTLGDLDTADGICRSIALAADCVVVAVNHRLAPEHDLRAGRDDCYAALQWLAANGAALGIDTSRLAIGGDSAGGNISAAVAQRSVREGGPALRLQVLVYPATELVEKFPSYAESAGGGFLLTGPVIEFIEETVADAVEGLNLEDPWFSPRRATDFSGLPPALVVTAGFDPIRDDGLDYSARLRAAGVPVGLLHYSGQFHGFLNFDAVIGAGRDAQQRIGEALAAAFRAEPSVDRTIEVADQPRATRGRLVGAIDQLTTTTLTASVASERWGDTLLRLLSPTLAGACQVALKPWLLPVNLLRRGINARLDRLAARQTYPTGSVSTLRH